jgi:hypothetical protein
MAQPAVFVNDFRSKVRELMRAQNEVMFAIRPYTAYGGKDVWNEIKTYFTEGNGADISLDELLGMISSVQAIDQFIKDNYHHTNLDKA